MTDRLRMLNTLSVDGGWTDGPSMPFRATYNRGYPLGPDSYLEVGGEILGPPEAWPPGSVISWDAFGGGWQRWSQALAAPDQGRSSWVANNMNPLLAVDAYALCLDSSD